MKKLTLTLILTAMISSLFAQETAQATVSEVEEQTVDTPETSFEDEKKFSLSGSADVYYRHNLSTDDQNLAPGTSFANLPGFSLGMANVVANHQSKKAGVTVDLAFGPRGEDATFLSSELRPGGNSSIVNQLYADYQFSDKVTATLGNFNTFLGYEVISPTGNFNYSTSYMFSYGPFSHTGVKLDAQLSDEFSIMGGVFNPTDATEYNPTNSYTGGVQLGYSKGIANIYVNGLFGDDYAQGDITAGFDMTEKLYLGINTTLADDLFLGAASYLQYEISEVVGLGGRVEYFQDEGMGLFQEGENVVDLTLSANILQGNLKVVPEFRLDLFSDDTALTASGNENSLSSFLIAAVYNFEK